LVKSKVNVGNELRNYVKKYKLNDKLHSILNLLDQDGQQIIDWAYAEANRQIAESSSIKKSDIGAIVFDLISYEAAVILIKMNHSRGRITTRVEIRAKTGQRVEMPVLYRDAGLRHPQEARNLRHNMFHEAFLRLIMHLFPDVTTSVPATGEGLTPDLMVYHKNPDWTISVEYKGYRSLTLLSESELLKAMRYQEAYGTAWLVTTTNKSVESLYGKKLNTQDIIEKGLTRLRAVYRRRAYTSEQRENRGIAKKGISHLEKHSDLSLKCGLYTVQELLESMRVGKPVKGVIVTTGFEFVEMLKEAGLEEDAEAVLRVMKLPTIALHSETVTSVRLIG
jgi:glycosyltransferase involved in cell wall biosynthesis